MTVVLDASAVVSALLDDGPDGRWCDRQMEADDIAAPTLLPFEVANIVRRTEAPRAIDASTAAQAMADLRAMPVHLLSFEPLAERIWELRANLTVYDASYVATAEAIGGPLVTLDRRLASAAGVRCEIRVAPDAEKRE